MGVKVEGRGFRAPFEKLAAAEKGRVCGYFPWGRPPAVSGVGFSIGGLAVARREHIKSS